MPKKEQVKDDDSQDNWLLWFENRDGQLYVAISVKKDFYDEVQLEELCYIVFLEKEKCPCLCYKKTEWIY